MSVGDLDVEHTGEFAAVPRRTRRRHTTRYNDTAIATIARVEGHSPAEQSDERKRGTTIAVLSTDPALADAIREAAGTDYPVTTAERLDQVVELAADGRCGILITDQVATQPVLRRMTHRLREAEPALVVIAVGVAGDQSGLISLLSAGVVDRLMLKPVTAALAQIVLKSAVQQRRTLQGAARAVTVIESQPVQDEAPPIVVPAPAALPAPVIEPAPIVVPASVVPTPATPTRRIDIPRPPWLAVVVALLAVAGLMWWIAADRKPAIDPQAVIATNLAAAQRAFHEGHALEPRGHSALDYYNTVLALDPANVAAVQGIDQIADRFAADAGIAIARGQIGAAIVAIDGLRRVRPEHRQLAELQAELGIAQQKYVAAVPKRVEPAPRPAPAPAPKPSVPTTPSPQKAAQAPARALPPVDEALKERLTFDAQLAIVENNVSIATTLLTQPTEPALSDAAEALVAAPPPPKLVRIVRPEYPQDALITHTEGWVDVSMSVSPAGDVLDARVEGSSNGMLFNRAALAVVHKWKYEAFAGADPQRVTVRVDFRLKDRR